MRQVFLAEILSSKGYQVTVCGLCGSVDDHRIRRAETLKEALEDAEVVAAPVPFFPGNIRPWIWIWKHSCGKCRKTASCSAVISRLT